ncbi:hypothetical protein TIFTF001_004775 [Ficus carica]|uniref:Uncharacterized protein n=1 Tax=Ficus carica TaxID=3494 RepID=A0AA87ZLY4_FICCA|nr:hypothetical protein TIFTF001_004775 [Ficus carica]
MNIEHSSVLTELKLDLGHSKRKQGKYNSAYSIGFVVYTCLRNVMENAMLCAMVSSLPATVDARWRGVAWQTVKCGKISRYAF